MRDGQHDGLHQLLDLLAHSNPTTLTLALHPDPGRRAFCVTGSTMVSTSSWICLRIPALQP